MLGHGIAGVLVDDAELMLRESVVAVGRSQYFLDPLSYMIL